MTFNLLPCLFASSKSARFCLNHFCREPADMDGAIVYFFSFFYFDSNFVFREWGRIR